jgi:serine/threonine protein kinase
MALNRGQLLNNRYQLDTQLGLDASRQTWQAIDLQSQESQDNIVIVKLLAMTPQMQWDESKLFEREAQVLQRLDHPRIPKYRDYFVLDGLADSRFTWFALVQSRIPGSSLQQLLDDGRRFTEADIEKIAIEVLTVLVYLHELDPPVLHRDIKPSNLIWGEDDRIYLVDFGSVQDTAVLEGATFTVVGTYGYVPIEQFGGRAVPASDLYALGATLIHLLTGVHPADLPQKDGRMQPVLQQTNLDIGLIHWLGKLTEPLVSDRLSSARQALDALENRQTLSPPITSRPPTGSQIRLHQSATHLAIDIPRYGWKAVSLLHILGALGGFIYYGLQFLQIDNFGILAATGIFFGIFLLGCLPAIQETSLSFDRQWVTISWKLFGLCYRRKRVQTSKINSTIGIYDAEKQGAKGIVIQTGATRLATNPMAKSERIWLRTQISNWLEKNSPSRSSENAIDLKNSNHWEGLRIEIFQSENKLEIRYPGIEKIGLLMTAPALIFFGSIWAIVGLNFGWETGLWVSGILTTIAAIYASACYANWFPSYAYFDRHKVTIYKKIGPWMLKDKTFSAPAVRDVCVISKDTKYGTICEVSLIVGDRHMTYPLGTNLSQSERDLMVEAIEMWIEERKRSN